MSEAARPSSGKRRLIFPPWFDKFFRLLLVVLAGGPVYVVLLAAYAGSAENTETGYQPEQPVDYSHALHAGKLGMDCRYCHTNVEDAAHAAVPPTQTCMNCHTNILPDSEKLVAVKESHGTGQPIRWKRVHDLPGFVYFDHSIHVRKGVGCATCHGRVDKMEVVYQQEPLSMGWCLECHREPERFLRPKDKVTVMDWEPEEDQLELGRRLKEEYGIKTSTNCSTCHR